MTNLACGLMPRAQRLLGGHPFPHVSSRDHFVTQWKSEKTFTRGSFLNYRA
jgi:hypothetical protein